jgi:hypothetical protein
MRVLVFSVPRERGSKRLIRCFGNGLSDLVLRCEPWAIITRMLSVQMRDDVMRMVVMTRGGCMELRL